MSFLELSTQILKLRLCNGIHIFWSSRNSEVHCGINTQVEKSKKIIIVNFMECDLNKLF